MRVRFGPLLIRKDIVHMTPFDFMQDIVKMSDSNIAQIVRARIQEQSGSESLAVRMVPVAAGEMFYAQTSQQLNEAIQTRTGLASPLIGSGSDVPPFPSVDAVPKYIQALVQQTSDVLPRLGSLLRQQAAQEMIMDLTTKILQRMAARSVKFVLAGTPRTS